MLWIWLDTPSVKVFNNIHSHFTLEKSIVENLHNWNLDIIKIIVNDTGDILWIFNKESKEYLLNEKWLEKSDIIDKVISFYIKSKLKVC